jgi:hypothetical protein
VDSPLGRTEPPSEEELRVLREDLGAKGSAS